MGDKPEGVRHGAKLSREWREKGYHCQVYADYRYFAGVIEGEVVAEASDRGMSAVIKEIRKDLEYREHKWRTEDLSLTYDEDEEIPQEYKCPVCEHRRFLDVPSTDAADDLLRHLKEEHPETVLPEPM